MPPELLAQFPIAERGDRGARARPLADGRVRGRRRDRRRRRPLGATPRASSRSSSARPTRTWPSACATTGSCSATAGAASPTTTPASARSGASRRPSIPDWLALVGDTSDGYPGLPGWGAKSAAAVLARYGLARRPSRRSASAWDVPGPPRRGRARRRRSPSIATRLRAVPDAGPAPAATRPCPSSRRTSCAGRAPPRSPGRRSATSSGLDRLRDAAASLDGRLTGPARRGASVGRWARARSAAWWAAGAANRPIDRVPRPRSNHGPPVEVGDGRARPLGDQARGRDVPGRQAALLDERVEPAVGDVGQGERRRAHRPRDPDGLADAPGPGSPPPGRPAPATRRSRTACPCPTRCDPARPFERRRPVGRGGEGLAPDRVVDDADDRPAVDDERDRDAEERDAVGVVDGAVERVDDPGPAAAGCRRLGAARGVVPAGLLGEDRRRPGSRPGWPR